MSSNDAAEEDPKFERSFDHATGQVVQISPLVRRIVCGNGGPFTFTGTCSYIVGRGQVAVIDPGPADAAHIEVLLAALAGETVREIVVTHTHRDHSPGARMLKAATGARISGCGPHRAARPLTAGEQARTESGGDSGHFPDLTLGDGEGVSGPGWSLVAVETPGHTANHLAFAFPEENALFSGDHVMAWSTTVVSPPDGAMRAYLQSLEKLRARENDAIYWPGHGGPVREPRRFVRALAHHRRQREAMILKRLEAGDKTIAEIVPRIYEGLDPRLHGAAALSVFAHLEDLCARAVVACDGPLRIDGDYRIA